MPPAGLPARRRAHLVGGGIGSLAAAAFMVRDGGMDGDQITIYDDHAVPGGSLDAGGDASGGYRLRGGRMFTTENYECTWALFRSIPSLATPGLTVYDETVAFNALHRSHAQARLVDRNRAVVETATMGFSMRDRAELLKLFVCEERSVGPSAITDWLSPSFFATNFWFLWSTTFAFQPWHSAIEFRRYLHRFILEFTRIDTLAGVKRTVFNQYDSLVRPLRSYLEAAGVGVAARCTVTQVALDPGPDPLVTGLTIRLEAETRSIAVSPMDLVIVQNASMTDASSFGSMEHPPSRMTKRTSHGWDLWEILAAGRPEFGRPAAFNDAISETVWESFTVTMQGTGFLDVMEALSDNEAGTGGLVTFRDSRWLLSIVIPHQPHFADQPASVTVFWGYALHPGRIGDFVAKPMEDCSGMEILQELCGHLALDLACFDGATCLPCRLPYITSMFMPRLTADRPLPVPPRSKNLGFVSQFVEIDDDVVFTVEYSIRAAQIAVYGLLNLPNAIPPVLRHDRSPALLLEAALKAFR